MTIEVKKVRVQGDIRWEAGKTFVFRQGSYPHHRECFLPMSVTEIVSVEGGTHIIIPEWLAKANELSYGEA